jgi:hypothetical protein
MASTMASSRSSARTHSGVVRCRASSSTCRCPMVPSTRRRGASRRRDPSRDRGRIRSARARGGSPQRCWSCALLGAAADPARRVHHLGDDRAFQTIATGCASRHGRAARLPGPRRC